MGQALEEDIADDEEQQGNDAGGLAEHHIPQLQPGRDGAHAAHADDVVHVVGVKQLVRVDAHGGHAHA